MDADFLVQEVKEASVSEYSHAPTMGGVKKLRYSHDAMVDLIVGMPGISQNELAVKFGYSASWVSNVMASDAFKARLAARRVELVDPTITASIEERFEGLARQSLDRLQEKLNAPQVSDAVVLKAVELGARGLGVGGFGAAKVVVPERPPEADRLARLAERLESLGGKGVTIEGEIISGAAG